MATIFTEMADLVEQGDEKLFHELVSNFEKSNPQIATAISELSGAFIQLVRLSKEKGNSALKNELNSIFGENIGRAARILCTPSQFYYNTKSGVSLLTQISNHYENRKDSISGVFPQLLTLKQRADEIVIWAWQNNVTRVDGETQYGHNGQVYRTNVGGASASAPKPIV